MADIRWADVIMAMEHKHKDRLTANFRQIREHAIIYVLNIPDDYRYMDPELVEHFEAVVPFLCF